MEEKGLDLFGCVAYYFLAFNKSQKGEVMKKDASKEKEAVDFKKLGLPETDVTALELAVKPLSSELVQKVARLVGVMNPNKKGFEEVDAPWAPPVVKIKQGLSTDAPPGAEVGDLYTDTGRILPRPLVFCPLYMYMGHVKFEPDNPNPVCSSEDCVTSRYGNPCADCPDLPFRDGQKTLCSRTMAAFVFNEDFSEVYLIPFSKTSLRAGTKLMKQAKADTVPWERWHGMNTKLQQRKEGPGEYYVATTAPTGNTVDPEMHPLADFFYGKISVTRKKILKRIQEKGSSAKRIMDEIGDTSPDDTSEKPSEPEFDDGTL